MKKYNIPIIDIQTFDVESIITASANTEQWQQGYEEEGAFVKSISYKDDLITFVF